MIRSVVPNYHGFSYFETQLLSGVSTLFTDTYFSLLPNTLTGELHISLAYKLESLHHDQQRNQVGITVV